MSSGQFRNITVFGRHNSFAGNGISLAGPIAKVDKLAALGAEGSVWIEL